jgi:hypothetical protein
MKKTREITYVFLDIGCVLLTNGWDQHARKCSSTSGNVWGLEAFFTRTTSPRAGN